MGKPSALCVLQKRSPPVHQGLPTGGNQAERKKGWGGLHVGLDPAPPHPGAGLLDAAPAWGLGVWPGAQLPRSISRWGREKPQSFRAANTPCSHASALFCDCPLSPSPVHPLHAPPLHN